MQLTSGQRDFILAHEREDVRETALRFTREDLPLLLTQIAGRQAAAKKIPSWYAESAIFYPPHLSLEQSSSELTARYKASLVAEEREEATGLNLTVANTLRSPAARKNGSFADPTGGMGVDFSFMARHFREAVYVERNEELCRIAEHNFGVLGLRNVAVRCVGAERFLEETQPLDLIYLDPSRRDNAGRKLFRIADCTPVLPEIKPLLFKKSDRVMVKYSPMLDISLAVKSLGCVKAVHVVSVDNECKELLFLLSEAEAAGDRPADEPLFIAVNLKRSGGREFFSFTAAQEQNVTVTFAAEPGAYLYEPNASILKAGAFRSVARMYGLRKLHVNSHLYTSDNWVEEFPGRAFRVEAFFTPNRKNTGRFSRETKKANITVRNFPATVAEIRRKTGLENGGDTYLFATTLAGERMVWIKCTKIR
jgi:16S rRNA G966 N2-methylase RsmD